MKYFNGILKSPIVWGGVASVGFYAVLTQERFAESFLCRYLANHPVEYVMTGMFFVGMAFLAIRIFGLVSQQHLSGKQLLEPFSSREPIEAARRHLARLDEMPASWQGSYLVGRLRNVLEYVRGSGSAADLEDELKYLADQDADSAHADYGLVRLIVWSIPIFGFLGTVIGIAQAIGSLQPESFAESLPAVTGGLTVAFDTTATALALSIILSFAQFLTDQRETRLLTSVDRAVARELSGRFAVSEAVGGNELGVVRQMLQSVVHAIEQMVLRQTELWQQSMEMTGRRNAELASEAARTAKETVVQGMAENVKQHVLRLAEAESQFTEKTRGDWQRLQESVSRSVESIERLQQGMTSQAKVMTRVVEVTGEVTRLEDRLNHNLAALAESGHFEETVNSLAAAIHLLNGRLSGGSSGVRLEESKNKGNAA